MTITQRLDTPQVRVYVATLRPHAPVPSKNGHATHRVLIYMDDGVMTRKEGADTATITFKRAFGEEPPRIRSIGIMTDSDNTGGDAEAYYGDILFLRAGVPAR